jgi:hypothetical protein
MIDDEFDRQLRESLSGLDLPPAPAALRVATGDLGRIAVEAPRSRSGSRMALVAGSVLAVVLAATAVVIWRTPATHQPPSSASKPPTAAPSAVEDDIGVVSCGRLEASQCDRVAELVMGFAGSDFGPGTRLVMDYACPPGARCQATFEALVVAIPARSGADLAYGVEGTWAPESVYDRPPDVGLPEHVLRLVRAAQGLTPFAETPTSSPVTAPQVTPPADLPTTIRHEVDGIRFTIELDRNPMPAGEPTRATFEVRNTGNDDVTWSYDGCATPLAASGAMTDVRWDPGVRHENQLFLFKAMALEKQQIVDGAVNLRIVLEEQADRGSVGCADIADSQTIAPGDAIRERAVFDGFATYRLGPPPSGPVTFQVWAASYWRASDGPPTDRSDAAIEFTFESWITGGQDPSRISPAEAVDGALADPDFAAWIAARSMDANKSPILYLDPATDLWQVGVIDYFAQRTHIARVDPVTGAVVEIVDAPWDPSDSLP